MSFTNLINYFYKNEKDLRLQKFPRHISISNIHYLLIKCNTFEFVNYQFFLRLLHYHYFLIMIIFQFLFALLHQVLN